MRYVNNSDCFIVIDLAHRGCGTFQSRGLSIYGIIYECFVQKHYCVETYNQIILYVTVSEKKAILVGTLILR